MSDVLGGLVACGLVMPIVLFYFQRGPRGTTRMGREECYILASRLPPLEELKRIPEINNTLGVTSRRKRCAPRHDRGQHGQVTTRRVMQILNEVVEEESSDGGESRADRLENQTPRRGPGWN